MTSPVIVITFWQLKLHRVYSAEHADRAAEYFETMRKMHGDKAKDFTYTVTGLW